MKQESGWRWLGAIALALMLALTGGPAFAQDEAEPEEQAAPDEDAVVLDEIVVTATKREVNQIDVPASLTVLSSDQLDLIATAGVDVRFLSARVPSVLIESSFGRAFPRFYVRGLGNTDFDLNASQPVSMLYDEVVLENPITKGMPIWDMDRIEVMRGPQGTLFGRNTPAGIVKMESKRPTRELDAYGRLSYGTFGTLDFNGAVGGPLTDTLSARVSGLFQSRQDWVDNEYTEKNDELGGYQNFAYRLQLLWEPNEQFSGLFNLHGWDVDGTARIFRANILEKGSNSLVDGFKQDKVAHDGLNQQDISSFGGVMKLDYDFGAATFTSVTGYESLDMYSRGDIDGGYRAVFAPPSGPGFIPFPSESADGLPYLDQWTQEFRFASPTDGPFDWLGGFFYFYEDLQADTFSYDSLGGNVQDGYSFQKQTAKSWALFGSLGYRPSDQWELRLGLRYTKDEKDFSAERPDPTFQLPTIRPIVVKTDDSFTDWNLSATYFVKPGLNVYGRVATAHRAPSIQGRILFAPDFAGGLDPATNGVSVADTEKVTSFELGLKSELLDRRVRFNLAGYYYEVDGQQLTAVGGEFNVATLLNADKTVGYGFETDLEFTPNSNWLFTMGLSYNPTEIQDKNLSVAPCGGGCTVLDPIGPNGALVDGNSLPHAPDWIFNGIIDYRTAIGSGLLMANLDWAYHDEKSFFLYESKEFKSDSLELGLRFAYAFSEAKYEVALFGRNILDEEIVRGGIDFNNLTGFTNDPAVWGLEFVARY